MFPKGGPHLRPHPGHKERNCLVPAGGDPTSNPTMPSQTSSRAQRACLLCHHEETSTSYPIPFTEDPSACPHCRGPTLNSLIALQTPTQSQRTPLVCIPRVGSHLKFHHCPSNPICITEAPLPPKRHPDHRGLCLIPLSPRWGAHSDLHPCIALSPWWRPHLNATLVTEDSFALSSWWAFMANPTPVTLEKSQ